MDFMDGKLPIRDPEVMARMKMAFELYETAEAMMRHRIRRQHPELTEEEVEERVVEWLMSRPQESYKLRPA